MNEYKVDFFWDNEANVWIASCDEIPLALEDGSLDKLMYRVKIAAPELIELNRLPQNDSLLFCVNQHEKMVYTSWQSMKRKSAKFYVKTGAFLCVTGKAIRTFGTVP